MRLQGISEVVVCLTCLRSLSMALQDEIKDIGAWRIEIL